MVNTRMQLFLLDIPYSSKQTLLVTLRNKGYKVIKGYRINDDKKKYYSYDELKLIYNTLVNREHKYNFKYICEMDYNLNGVKMILDNPDKYAIELSETDTVRIYHKRNRK